MRHLRALLGRGLALVLIGCQSSDPTEEAGTFDGPRDLSATLVEGRHVDLAWRHDATAPGGGFVEFKMGHDEERFTMLDAVWTGRTGYRHPDVAPDSRFIYRIRSFYGRPSEAIAVRTARKGKADQDLIEGRLDGAGGIVVDEPRRERPGFAPHAAPTHFIAQLAGGTTVELRWRDNAPDEDGYLVELSVQPDAGYRIAAILPPDSTSFRKIALEEETRFYFRVRPFFYGPASNLASVVTPSMATQDAQRRLIERPEGAGGP